MLGTDTTRSERKPIFDTRRPQVVDARPAAREMNRGFGLPDAPPFSRYSSVVGKTEYVHARYALDGHKPRLGACRRFSDP